MDQYPFEFKLQLFLDHYYQLRAAIVELGEDWEGVVEDLDEQLNAQCKAFFSNIPAPPVIDKDKIG